MAEMNMYNALNANIVIGGRTIQGFQENDMFSYTFDEEQIKTSVDAQGKASGAINNNHSGKVTINLSGTSVDHKYLNNIGNAHKEVTLQINSEFEKITGTQAYITKIPDGAFGKDVPKRTYVFKVLDLHVDAL